MRLHPLQLLALVALSAPASAQNVAIAAAASSTPTACQFTDVQGHLVASGQFTSVDIVDVVSSTPSLATLLTYDAVITWSNVNYNNPVALGDVLADYVDAGGGVVVTVFANSTTSLNRRLEGRWLMGYEVIPSASGNFSGSASLGTVVDPGHPVMAGVNSFSGGTSSFRPSTTALTAGSSLIAQWSDGRTLVAEGPMPQRIDLGFYPPSNNCTASWWDTSTDGAALLSNALAYVAGAAVGVGTPYCFGDGSGTACPCGNTGGAGEGCANRTGSGATLAAGGSNDAVVDDLTFDGTGMIPGAPALLFVGNDTIGPGGDGNPFGDGLRCAGINVVRLGLQIPDAGGNASWGPGLGAIGGWMPGDTRRFQSWYRDPPPETSPCGTGFNLSHGVEVTFQ